MRQPAPPTARPMVGGYPASMPGASTDRAPFGQAQQRSGPQYPLNPHALASSQQRSGPQRPYTAANQLQQGTENSSETDSAKGESAKKPLAANQRPAERITPTSLIPRIEQMRNASFPGAASQSARRAALPGKKQSKRLPPLAVVTITILAFIILPVAWSLTHRITGPIASQVQASSTTTPPTTPGVQTTPTLTTPGGSTGTNGTPAPIFTPDPAMTPDPGLPPAPKNPWGYDFKPSGHLIYHPLSDFCNYFNCTEDFTTGTGYIVECRDSLLSLSGGTPDACIFDGGVSRTLYSHT